MKALWGTVSLLVALAIVGLVTVRQLRAVGHATQVSLGGLIVGPPSTPASGNVAQQAQALERQVADDVAKALKQGADARAGAADPPP